MTRIIFFFIIISVIIYFQYNFIHEYNSSFEILQYSNPNKDIFENILNNKLISVFTDIVFNVGLKDKNYDQQQFKYDYYNKKIDVINPIIKENFSYYDIPLNIYNTIELKSSFLNTKTPLKIQSNFRQLIYQLEGTRVLYLFPPNNKKYLYFNNNTTPIDFWNQDVIKYPFLKNSKYIEIILHPGQMISVPYKWIFASITNNLNFTIYYTSESLFSYFLK